MTETQNAVASLEDVVLAFDVSPTIITQISGLTGTSLNVALGELVKNSYDSIDLLQNDDENTNSNQIHITYEPSEDRLVISDQGSGMTRSQVKDQWLYVGDSSKVDSPNTPDGRRKLGAFGIGTTVIPQLGESVEMRTTSNSVTTILRHSFDKPIVSGEPLDFYDSRNAKKGERGTVITVSNLKFNADDLTSANLKRHLQRVVPLNKGVDVLYNGKLIKSRMFQNARKFAFTPEDDSLEGVTGTFYLLGRPDPVNAGIHLLVHGSQIGGPSDIVDLARKRAGFQTRIAAEIEVGPALEDQIKIDRTGFKTNDPRYQKLAQELDHMVSQLAGAEREIQSSGKAEKIYLRRNVLLGKLKTKMKSVRIDGLPQINNVQLYKGDPNTSGYIQGSTAYLNENHPSLTVTDRHTLADYLQHLESQTAQVCTAHLMEKNHQESQPFSAYDAMRSQVICAMEGLIEQPPSDLENCLTAPDGLNRSNQKSRFRSPAFSKELLTIAEAKRELDASNTVVQYLITVGLLSNKRITRQEVADCSAILDQYISLPEIVESVGEKIPTAQMTYIRNCMRKVGSLEQSPLIYTTNGSCETGIFVDRAKQQEVMHLFGKYMVSNFKKSSQQPLQIIVDELMAIE